MSQRETTPQTASSEFQSSVLPYTEIRFSLDELSIGEEQRSAEVSRDGADRLWWGEPSLGAAIRYYRRRMGQLPATKDDLIGVLSADEAELDSLLGHQVDQILHHPRFQQLEAAWRGISMLTDQADGLENVRVRLLQLTKQELGNDLMDAVQFDQSNYFRMIYTEEYDQPGGSPFGVVIGDYSFDDSAADIDLLRRVSGISAAAFAPFVAAVDAKMLGIPNFKSLERFRGLGDRFNTDRFVKWKSLRDSEDSRYIGLTLPRVLMRLPYESDPTRCDGFMYREDSSAANGSAYLWGNAAFAFGTVLIRAFTNSGWFADIRGSYHGAGWGGVVDRLPVPSFGTDRTGVVPKTSIETALSDEREKELSSLGFIPICDCQDSPYSVFLSNQSIQRPRQFHEADATTNARMSAMLQYVFCASRFAHYLKVSAREKIGSFAEPSEIEDHLHNWIQQYVTIDPGAPLDLRAKYPLRDAKVVVDNIPGDPGHFMATFYFRPHYQLDDMMGSLKLSTRLKRD